MALNMLRLYVKLSEMWGFTPHFCYGALSGNQHSSTSFGAEATSCGKVLRMSVYRRRKKWLDS